MRRVLWLLLFSTALAQPPQQVEVTFQVVPEDAVVKIRNQENRFEFLTEAGRPARFEVSGSATILAFEREGWNSAVKTIPNVVLQGNSEWPESGEPLTLTASNWTTQIAYLGQQWGLTAAVVMGMTLVGGLWTRSRYLAYREMQTKLLNLETLAREEGGALGARLGRFRLVEKLGKGGMATVYRAVPDNSLDDQESVALKVLVLDGGGEHEGLERFRREVRAYQNLSHPHIVRLLDWGEKPPEAVYIVMELLEGGTLHPR